MFSKSLHMFKNDVTFLQSISMNRALKNMDRHGLKKKNEFNIWFCNNSNNDNYEPNLHDYLFWLENDFLPSKYEPYLLFDSSTFIYSHTEHIVCNPLTK